MAARAARQHGFTLLELVIAMTLTVLLLGMLSAGVYSVVSDWQRETRMLDEALDESLVLLQVERALNAAFPHIYWHPETLDRTVYFYGDAHEIRFVSTLSPQRTPGLTAWNLVSDAQDGLLMRLTPAYADNPDSRLAQLEPQPLLAGYDARFRYLVQSDIDDRQWLDEWPAETMQSLPLAVGMVLTPRPADSTKAVLEVLATIRVNRHPDIAPTIPAGL